MSSFRIGKICTLAAAWIGLAMTAGSPASAQNLTSTLTGTVTAEQDQTAIANAKVRVGKESTRTNASGQYTLTLPVGVMLEVKADGEDFDSQTKTVTLAVGQTTTLDFSLQRDDDDDDEDDQEDREGTIRGRVVDAVTGRDIRGATVTAGSLSVRTDSDGKFELEDIAAGDYTLTVSAEGYGNATQTVTLAGRQDLSLTIVLTPTGETPPSTSTGTVSGIVRGEDNAPLSGVTVRVGSIIDTTDAQGAFTLEGVKTGNVVVVAQAEGYLSGVKTADVTANGTATVDFNLTERPNPLPNRGTIHGRVVSEEDGTPVVGATVTLDGQTAQTDLNGEFTLENLRPGRARYTVTAPGFEAENEDIVVHPFRTVNVTVELEADDESGEAQTGTLTGTVISNGQPVTGAVVRVGRVSATTDAEGKFTLSNVRTGVREVTITKPGFRTVEQDVVIAANGTATLNVSLTPKENNGNPQAGTGTLRGAVFGTDGKPVSGATVMVRGLRTTTDADGRFEFTNLPRGKYQIQVWAENYRHTHKRAELDSGQTLTVDVTLHPKRGSSNSGDEDDDKGGDENVGDADADGSVAVGDVIAALREALGLADLSGEVRVKLRLDVAPSKAREDFGDDKVDIKDAIKLLRFVLKLDLVLP